MPDLNNPLYPPNDGKIGLPRVLPGMNRLAPINRPPQSRGSKNQTKLTSTTESAKILRDATNGLDKAISRESENRKNALDDLKFLAGDQWPADVASQRNFDKRPCLTINKLPTFVHQIMNDLRQNRPAIDIDPVGDRGDKEAAKMYRGLIRALERACRADIAYDTGAFNQISNGWGYWRVLTEWDKPDSFDQTIVARRIRNPFTVYLGEHQEPDGSDCREAWVTEMIPKDEFKLLWPNADTISFMVGGLGEKLQNWFSGTDIRVAEYFKIEHEKRKLVELSNGHIGWEDELSDDVKAFLASGVLTVEQERESVVPTIKWHKLTAVDVLESQEWPGKWIPVVKAVGDEIDIEGKVKYSGIVRNAKDPQRMYNYWRTLETELIALAPKAPWLIAEGQDEGYEQDYKTANTRNIPVLRYRPIALGGQPVPPPSRQPFASVPAGVVQAIAGAAQDMMATTGIRFDASMQERTADESGVAMRELRRSSDLGSFHYGDNYMRSLRHTGDIYVDLIPKIFTRRQMATILREDDEEERIMIDPNAPKAYAETRGADGKTMKIFNPNIGQYGVTVTIGPSFATKRIEASQSMMEFAKALPNAAGLIMDLIAKNMDWEGSDEMAKRLAKALPPQLLTPDQKDIPPQVQAMLLAMDGQIKQMTQERQQLMAALTEKKSEQAIEMDKINKDFEVKLLGVVAKFETAQAATQEKAVASFNAHIGSRLENLAQDVNSLREKLAKPEKEAANA